MSVSISTPSGRTMASAATVVSSTTASQNPAQAPAPPHWIAHQLSTGAAQSRYRQAKAALKAIKRQIVPVDAFGNRKPRLRGWLHLATLPLCIAASIVLICIAPAGSVKAACAVYGCLCSISCCGFSHDDFSGLGRACRPRNGLNWMVLVSPPERTGKDYDQHAPSTVYPSFAAERGIRRVDRAENTCQRADGA